MRMNKSNRFARLRYASGTEYAIQVEEPGHRNNQYEAVLWERVQPENGAAYWNCIFDWKLQQNNEYMAAETVLSKADEIVSRKYINRDGEPETANSGYDKLEYYPEALP